MKALIAALALLVPHSAPHVTQDEFLQVQVGWTEFHTESVFGDTGDHRGNWYEGPDHYREVVYAGDAANTEVKVVYLQDDELRWRVFVPEWCTILPTGDLTCLT